jgi:hypothetical protein
MSMNITPHIPQVVVNAAAPTTEALAKANAVREVVPPVVQTEAAVPQKSREQDRRPSNSAEDVTYAPIQKSRGEVVNQIGDDQDSEFDGEQAKQNEQDSVAAQGQDGTASDSASDAEPDDEAGQVNASQDDSQQNDDAQQQAEQAQEQKVISQLQSRDREVRAHEQAHAAIGGAHAGAPSYTYQTGPDGKKYAVGGEVSIDVSPESTPQATIRKMEVVRAAALAPAEPSSQDRKVAAQASMQITQARAQLATESSPETRSSAKTEQAESNDVEIAESEPDNLNRQKSALTGEVGEQLAAPSKSVQQVILNRYHSSYRFQEQGFNAVA